MAKKYRGKYIGLVVTGASEDPEGRNRIQVWVPHVMNTVYENWNNKEDDKVIFNLNTQRSSMTTQEIERLRNSLPWAECASPLMGGGAPFATNRVTGSSSISTEKTLEEPSGSDVGDDVSYTDYEDIDLSQPLEDLPELLPESGGSSGSEGINDIETAEPVVDGEVQTILPTE